MSLAASSLRFTMIKVFCSVKRDTSESIKWDHPQFPHQKVAAGIALFPAEMDGRQDDLVGRVRRHGDCGNKAHADGRSLSDHQGRGSIRDRSSATIMTELRRKVLWRENSFSVSGSPWFFFSVSKMLPESA